MIRPTKYVYLLEHQNCIDEKACVRQSIIIINFYKKMVLDVNWFKIYLNLGSDAEKTYLLRERKAKNLFMRTIHKNCISYFICQISEGFHPLNLSLCYGLDNFMLCI